jgi:hypothetical protein
MSNSLSIATVTACFRKILENAFTSTTDEDEIESPKVTTLPPYDNGVPQVSAGERGANIFLYQVTPNAHWRNTDLPTRNRDGDMVMRPRVAFDLHYLLTFYGDETRLEAQRLLGIASRTLHTQPVLSRTLIAQTIAAPPAGLAGVITNSDLADAEELVRLIPASLSVDELSRIWSLLAFQTKYVLSLVYQASVVLIDRNEAVREAQPVRVRNVYVDVINPPFVERVVSDPDPDAPIVAGATLVITGRGLRGDRTRIAIDGDQLATLPTEVEPARVVFTLPAGVSAGTRGLQVVLLRDMGTPPVPHRGAESNVFPFVLHPSLTADPVKTVGSTVVVDGVTLVTGTLTLTVEPAMGQAQRVALLLNQVQTGPLPPSGSYVFAAPSRDPAGPPASAAITIAFSNVAEGTYFVRVRVDGATSELTATRQVVLP